MESAIVNIINDTPAEVTSEQQAFPGQEHIEKVAPLEQTKRKKAYPQLLKSWSTMVVSLMQDLEAEIHALEDGKDPLLPGLHSLIPPSQPENNIHIYFK